MSESQIIGGITYDNVDPGGPFVERPAAPQDWYSPVPTPDETRAGLLAYVTSDPGEYEPKRLPKVQEHARSLSTFLTPGEERAVWFGVSALGNIEGLQIKVGSKDVPVKVNVRNIHFWPQRTQWKGFTWYMTPELLLPCANGKRTVPAKRGVLTEEAFDLKSGETAGFWLTVSADSNAKAGKYTASVSVKSRDKAELVLPLEIEILPFKLQQPKDRRWLLYADIARWNKMNDNQIVEELKDFKRHGFTGMVEFTLASFDLSPMKTGGAPKVDTSFYKRITKLCDKAGIPGPHVIYAGALPESMAETLGIKIDLNKDEWPNELKEGIKTAVKAVIEATKNDAPWYFYGPDEPSGDNTYALQVYECWHEAGAKTYATFYTPGFLNKALKHMTIPCFAAGMLGNEGDWKRYYEQCNIPGVDFSWYGTGCYVNPYPQERYMYHNRYGAGFFFWKTKAVNAVAWTLCRPHGDVFNDFDGVGQNQGEPKEQAFVYPHLLKEDDWSTFQGDIPTIAWESHRDGWNDYLYINTLNNLILEKQSNGSQSAKAAAEAAKTRLAELVDNIPFANIMGEPVFDTKMLYEGRSEVAKMILELRSKK